MLGWFSCFLFYGDSQKVWGTPMNYPFLCSGTFTVGYFDRSSGKDHSLERPFNLILHITMQLPSRPRDLCEASGIIKDAQMSLV